MASIFTQALRSGAFDAAASGFFADQGFGDVVSVSGGKLRPGGALALNGQAAVANPDASRTGRPAAPPTNTAGVAPASWMDYFRKPAVIASLAIVGLVLGAVLLKKH